MSIAKIQPSVNGIALTLAPHGSSEFDICWSNKNPSDVDPKAIRRWLEPLKKKLPKWVGTRVWIVEQQTNWNQTTKRYDLGYPDVRYNLYIMQGIKPADEEFDIEKFLCDFAEVAKLHDVDGFRLYLKENRGWEF